MDYKMKEEHFSLFQKKDNKKLKYDIITYSDN